jgi:KDO2-lipid IV(A) lauroyltransferase
MGRGFESLLRHQVPAPVPAPDDRVQYYRGRRSPRAQRHVPVFRLLTLLPFPVLRALAAAAAFCARAFGWRRKLVDQALDRCLSDCSGAERGQVARDFYRYLGELVAEVVYADKIPLAELEARVVLDNPEVVQQTLDAGKRVMILAAHHCNWEWLLLRCSRAFNDPLVAAYKPASREAGDRALKNMRTRFGATMVPAKQIVQALIERRGKVRLLAMLADQSPAASNDQQVWLPFFGRETAFFRGPGWIASKLGYTVVLAAMRRTRSGHYAVRFMPLTGEGRIADPDDVLIAYVRELQAHVHEHPAEYFWAYNRWKREKRLYDN